MASPCLEWLNIKKKKNKKKFFTKNVGDRLLQYYRPDEDAWNYRWLKQYTRDLID